MKHCRSNNPVKERKALKISLSVLFALALVFTTFVTAGTCFDLNYALWVNVCSGRDEDVSAGVKAFLGLITLASPLASLVTSIWIIVEIRKNLGSISPTAAARPRRRPFLKKDTYTIPVRSLVLSALLSFVPILVVASIMTRIFDFEASKSVASKTTTFLVLLVSLFRCPIMTRFAFKVKASCDIQDRERRQQRERDHAMRAREERKEAKIRRGQSCTSATTTTEV